MQALGNLSGQGNKLRKTSGSVRRLLLYALVGLFYQALVIALAFLLTRYLLPSAFSIPVLYPVFLVLFLLLGLMHGWLERHYLPHLSAGGIGWRLLFCGGLMGLGVLLLAVGTVYLYGSSRLPFVFSGTTLLFPVPLLWKEAYRRWTAIPEPAFKPWWLPINRPAPDIDLVDLSAIQVIRFEFRREPSDAQRADSRAKAPVHMPLGDLFHVFLTDYNERFSGNPIRLIDDLKRPYGWIFYVRPRFWWQSRRYLDPSFNFDQNRINDSDRVVAQRINNNPPATA